MWPKRTESTITHSTGRHHRHRPWWNYQVPKYQWLLDQWRAFWIFSLVSGACARWIPWFVPSVSPRLWPWPPCACVLFSSIWDPSRRTTEWLSGMLPPGMPVTTIAWARHRAWLFILFARQIHYCRNMYGPCVMRGILLARREICSPCRWLDHHGGVLSPRVRRIWVRRKRIAKALGWLSRLFRNWIYGKTVQCGSNSTGK